MAAHLLLLIAARSIMSCATRFKPGPSVGFHITAGPMMQRISPIHTQVNVPQLKMAVDESLEDDVIAQMVVPNRKWKASRHENSFSAQMFPPAQVPGFETTDLLRYWRQLYKDSLRETDAEPEQRDAELEQQNLKHREKWALPPPAKTPETSPNNRALVLANMRDVTIDAKTVAMHMDTPTIFEHLAIGPGHISDVDADFISTNKLPKPQMVGLISKAFIKSGSSDIEESLGALAMFSRLQLKDDRRHSLRNKVMQLYGHRHWWSRNQWGRRKKVIEVFAIEGLVHAPDLPEQLARVLLSKIQKYAHKENRIVVVPQWAFSWTDGTELTEYYVRLGFEKIEMQDGLHQLVYMGSSVPAEDKLVERQQIMIGMNLWAGQDDPGSPPGLDEWPNE